MKSPRVKKEEYALKARYHLLREWYGEEVAAREMVAHCPPPENIADAALGLLAKTLGPDLAAKLKLEENWTQVAGEFVAKITRVGFYRDGSLTIEVNHPLYLRELESVTDFLIANVNNFGIKCTKLHFAPAAKKRKI